MGNTMSWQETADGALAQLAISLQPHHHAKLNEEACFALACMLRQQLDQLPRTVIEAAILSDMIERMESRIVTYPAPMRLHAVPSIVEQIAR